jgi:hypothetical protein
MVPQDEDMSGHLDQQRRLEMIQFRTADHQPQAARTLCEYFTAFHINSVQAESATLLHSRCVV